MVGSCLFSTAIPALLWDDAPVYSAGRYSHDQRKAGPPAIGKLVEQESTMNVMSLADWCLMSLKNVGLDDNGLAKKRTSLSTAISKIQGTPGNNVTSFEDHAGGHYCYTAIHFTGKAGGSGYQKISPRLDL